MQMRRRRGPARQNERRQGGQRGVHSVDFGFQARGLARGDPQGAGAAAPARGHAQVRAEVEQVVLDARQHRVGVARKMQAREANRRVRFVHRAAGFDARGVLGHAVAVAERGLAGVAAAGIDPVELDHAVTPRRTALHRGLRG